MGKSSNQIATWKDLSTIGYRIPSQYRSSSECVTYQNLEDLENSTDRTSRNTNVALTKSYFNGNTTTGFTFTRSSDITTFEDELPSLGILANTAGVSSTNYTVLGTLGSLYVNEPVELRTPELRIYLTMIPVRDVPTGTLHYRLTIRSGSSMGSVVAESSWRIYGVANVEDKQMRYYFDDPILISVSSGSTYYLVLEWYTDLSYTSRGIFVSFKINESFSKWDCYCPTMCVPWNRIKGSIPQLTSGISLVKVPVLCYVEEHMSANCPTLNCRFYYKYKLSGSDDWNMLQVGYATVSTNSSGISGSAQTTCYVTINPLVSGNIVADCLYMEIGNLSVSKHWKYKVEHNGSTPTSWTDSVNATSTKVMIDWESSASLGSFNRVISGLTGLYFYISA